jgi:hypothetical protein
MPEATQSNKEIRQLYCKVCGRELKGKIIRIDGWSYHLDCWKKSLNKKCGCK